MNKNYKEISSNVSAIFRTMKSLYVIQPTYFLNWSLVKNLLMSEIDEMLREKGAIGAARAKQIENYTMSLIYKYLSFSLSQNHFTLFLLLHFHSLKTSKAKVNLKKNKQSTESKLDETYFYSLLSLAVRGNELQSLCQQDFTILNSQPDFIGLNNWVNCWQIEQKSSNLMHDLCRSMRENSSKWIEYFRLEQVSTDSPIVDLTQKDIDLLNESPLGSQLGILEKLALWLCLRPDKVSNHSAKIFDKKS